MVFAHYLSQRCLWKRWGEAQLIGNIWVIVGSTPTSSNAGRDLTVPSEVTALTSAGAQACSCQGALGLEKRTEPGAPGAGWCRGFWWELCWQPTFESHRNATSLLMPSVVRRHRTPFFWEGGRRSVGCAWSGTMLRHVGSRPYSVILLKISTMQNTIMSPSSFHPQHAGQKRSCLCCPAQMCPNKREKKNKPVGTIPF